MKNRQLQTCQQDTASRAFCCEFPNRRALESEDSRIGLFDVTEIQLTE